MDANRILPLIALSLLATALAPAGHAAVPVATDHVVINEVLYDPVGDQVETVELHNPTAVPVVLDGWTLRDDDYCASWQADTPQLEGVLAPGAYVEVELPNTYGGLTCNNLASEELLLLEDPSGATVDTVGWGGEGGMNATEGESLQRDYLLSSQGDPSDDELGTVTWTAASPSLGSPNVATG